MKRRAGGGLALSNRCIREREMLTFLSWILMMLWKILFHGPDDLSDWSQSTV